MTDFNQKVVLITGASGSIGQELVYGLLNENASLILTDKDYDELDLMVKSIFTDKGKILGYFSADLSDKNSANHIFKQSLRFSENIDIFINNAAFAASGGFELVPEETIDQIIDINFRSPLKICRLFIPQMLERRSGHIVNISSITGFFPFGELSIFSASKFAISGFGEAMSNYLSPYGIKVTNIYPSFIRAKILYSEQYGFDEKQYIPDYLIGEPVPLVRKIIKAVKKDKSVLYPGFVSRFLYLLRRISPSVSNRIINIFKNKYILKKKTSS